MINKHKRTFNLFRNRKRKKHIRYNCVSTLQCIIIINTLLKSKGKEIGLHLTVNRSIICATF